MKRNIHFLLLLSFSILVFVSCNKEHQAVTKVINVSLKPGEAYTYQIPSTGDADDVMQITKQASHAASTSLDFKNNTTPSTFQYTPVTDYTGTDEVDVSTVETHNGSSGQHHQGFGQCQGGHHHDEGTTYIFKITISAGNNPG